MVSEAYMLKVLTSPKKSSKDHVLSRCMAIGVILELEEAVAVDSPHESLHCCRANAKRLNLTSLLESHVAYF